MTRNENLIALRDAVVEGDVSHADIERCLIGADATEYPSKVDYALHASRGDMNAALAFVAEVLPDSAIAISMWPRCDWCVSLNGTHEHDGEQWCGADDYVADGRADTPARALLIAALNALIEETEE